MINYFFFFFNDTATTEIYTLSYTTLFRSRKWIAAARGFHGRSCGWRLPRSRAPRRGRDRKSTRLNSSHGYISYAVFCLKKKKKVFLSLLSVVIKLISRSLDPLLEQKLGSL